MFIEVFETFFFGCIEYLKEFLKLWCKVAAVLVGSLLDIILKLLFVEYGGVFVNQPTVYDGVEATDSLFIRAFNTNDLAAFAAAGGYYGNSQLQTEWATNLDAVPPPLPDKISWYNGVTDIYFAGGGGSVIPEPSTVMLALAGALMVLRKLRK